MTNGLENIIDTISTQDKNRIINKAKTMTPEGCTYKELTHVDLYRARFIYVIPNDGSPIDQECDINSDMPVEE